MRATAYGVEVEIPDALRVRVVETGEEVDVPVVERRDESNVPTLEADMDALYATMQGVRERLALELRRLLRQPTPE